MRYEHGQDRINGDYNTVGGFVTVGLQLENLLNGESPFAMPEPVFRSPRDLRRLLGQKVKRNWHQPASALAASNQTAIKPIVVYFFYGPGTIVSGVPFMTSPPSPPPSVWQAFTGVTITWHNITSPSVQLATLDFYRPAPGPLNSLFFATIPFLTTGDGTFTDLLGTAGGSSNFTPGAIALNTILAAPIVVGPGGYLSFEFF